VHGAAFIETVRTVLGNSMGGTILSGLRNITQILFAHFAGLALHLLHWDSIIFLVSFLSFYLRELRLSLGLLVWLLKT
jgi:hypothetical protein